MKQINQLQLWNHDTVVFPQMIIIPSKSIIVAYLLVCLNLETILIHNDILSSEANLCILWLYVGFMTGLF